ncbi:TetR family transcriptional regulator [Anseongella ginsenosidimutans]|uniref:TetR family transcriptional regulator n=1 Tax=Anseongella ginsenosidimutans TaxID=496056 RepID=A0A4R3KNR7_9SPHI|nr:TetR/AcrR family transcriptional regulator [Anseongella ginsenosidimutans]QEC53740.1 TetR/AcrR family transcriptional regulator [Anseongella ginsenosidimutans]TCS86004.1 TetR family transcriptional regulator [Anseongella ginsenosidimutans]
MAAQKKRREGGQDKSRQKILAAAFELFAEKGYSQTPVDSIAAKANVSKGLIYHYFENKEHILKGVFARLKEEGDVLYEGVDSLSPEEFLERMIDISMKYVIHQTKSFRLMLALTLQTGVTKGLKKEIEEIRNEWLSGLAQVFKSLDYEDPETEAYLLSALLDGIGVGYMVMRADYPMEEIKELIMKRYGLRGSGSMLPGR